MRGARANEIKFKNTNIRIYNINDGGTATPFSSALE